MQTLSESSAADAGLSGPQPGLNILVVEDDEADAYLLCRALAAQPGVGRVVRAQDGVEALQMVERGDVKPDLAFIDLHMPRKDGFSLLIAFAEREEAGFPMMVLTSSSAPTDAIRSRLRGAVGVLTKPDTANELGALLSSAIDAACSRRSRPEREKEIFKAKFHGIPATQYLIAIEEDNEAQEASRPS